MSAWARVIAVGVGALIGFTATYAYLRHLGW